MKTSLIISRRIKFNEEFYFIEIITLNNSFIYSISYNQYIELKGNKSESYKFGYFYIEI